MCEGADDEINAQQISNTGSPCGQGSSCDIGAEYLLHSIPRTYVGIFQLWLTSGNSYKHSSYVGIAGTPTSIYVFKQKGGAGALASLYTMSGRM